MGGGGKSPSVPDIKVPSVGEVASQAIDANISNLPKLLKAYAQYGPEYSNTVNNIFKQGQAQLKELFPEQYDVQSKLGKNISANLGFIGDANNSGIPQPLLEHGQNLIRSAQAGRGNAMGPISVVDEAVQLAPLAETFRSNVTNEAQNYLNGKQLTTPGSQVGLDTLGLDPISSTELFKGNLDLTQLDIDNQYQQFALQNEAANAAKAKKASTWKNIGSAVGVAAGVAAAPFTGGASLAFIPQLSQAGGAIGQAGGTYF